MTDQTSADSSETTTNDELGVLGKQLAVAESQRTQTGDQSTALSRGDTLALEALRLAIQQDETPRAVVDRAEQYLEFLKGKDNG